MAQGEIILKVYLLIDRSGSMAALWNEAIASVNTYVKGLAGDTAVYVAVFDDHGFDEVRNTSRDAWTDIANTEITPRGMTPLYDSVGRIAAMAEADNHLKSVIIIMTDGHENASKEYTRDQIDMKLKQLDKRGYQTIFLGAGFKDVTFVGHKIGRRMDQTINLAEGNLVRGMSELSTQTAAYASLGSHISFSGELREDLDKDKTTK